MSLWVPPKVSRELMEERYRHNAELLHQFERNDPVCARVQPDWSDFDHRLFVARARGNASYFGVRPGFYHVLRVNEDAPMTVEVIEGPQGQFRELTARVLEEWKGRDLWNGRVVRDQAQARAAREGAREREQANEREQRRDELKDRAAAAFQTRVSFNRDQPWTQNVSGRRGAQR